MSSITAEEIKALTQYIYAVSGVALDASKAYLLETRLKHLLQQYACRTYMDLHAQAKADRSGALEKEIVDAITTNETLFFRDASPFEVFKHKILPEIIDARSKAFPGRPTPLRIWSAACSTGQEVYSIAIALREALGNLSGYQISILGTDISDDAVSKASYGKYNKFEIERGLPPAVLHKYFSPTGDGWRIKDEIRAMAMFKKYNLMKPFTGLGKFDVVFCRNVAIYFTPSDKKMVFEKIAGVLEPDGALIIGSTESLTGVTSVFEAKRYLRSIFYQPAGNGAGAGLERPAFGTFAPPAPTTRPPLSVAPRVPTPSRPVHGTAAALTARPGPPRPQVQSSASSTSISRPVLGASAPTPSGRLTSTPIHPVPAVNVSEMSKPSVAPIDEPVEAAVHPAQFVRPRSADAKTPVKSAQGASRTGDKTALKRLIMKKKAAQTQSS